MSTLAAGEVFAGYRIDGVVGRGGMGLVYRATESRPERTVALKVIAPHLAADADFRERFLRESQIAASIEHPNVVPVWRIGEEDGMLFLAMRFIRGRDLASLIAAEGRLDPFRAATIVDQVADALDTAHEQGLVHRDVKPGNLLIENRRRGEHVYLTDFGLTKQSAASTRLTRTGAAVGTIDYMAPEQFEARRVDARADVYSLGCVLFEALTGQIPYPRAGEPARIYAHLAAPPPKVSDVVAGSAPQFDEIVARALAKDPDARYLSAGDLAFAALAAAEGQPVIRAERSVASGLAAPADQREMKAPSAAHVPREPLPADQDVAAADEPADDTDEPTVTGQGHQGPLDRSATGAEAPPREAALPPALEAASRHPFVGRIEALDALRASWSEAQAGRTTMSLISGEPGIGKTRLAALFAQELQEAGAMILYGRCDEDPLVSYEPFVEALRALVAQVPGLDRQLDPKLEPEVLELSRLVPELRRHGTSEYGAPSGDQAERYLLFEAVLALFTQAAATRPVLLVLDDLHWADKPTALLLHHLLRAPSGGPTMLLGTTRDGLGPEHPLVAALADLYRDGTDRLQRVALGGFDEAETGALVNAQEHGRVDEGFIPMLHKLTSGNPFFIGETLRGLHDLPHARYAESSLRSLGVPAGADEVIQRRLSRLRPEAVELLAHAAVCGLEFQLDLLAVLMDIPPARALPLLEEALSAGLVVEPSVDRFMFCHALVRDALYNGLGSHGRRARLHLAVGEALERLANGGAPVAELAHHFHAATHVGGAPKALVYALAAADRAADALAYEEAAEFSAKALDALQHLGPSHEAQALRILHSVGRLRWKAGDRDGAQAAFLREAELARTLGDPEQFARAALGFAGRWYDAEQLDPLLIDLLEEALRGLPDSDSALRARVMGALADALQFSDLGERVSKLSHDAWQMARRSGDRDALISVLGGRHNALLYTAHLPERLRISAEWLELAEEVGHRDSSAQALTWRIYDLFELGDLAAARALHQRLIDVANDLKQPLYQAFAATWEFNLLELAGRFDEAEAAAAQCFRYARLAQGTFASSLYGAQLFVLRRDQGRLAELAELVEPLVGSDPKLPVWRAAMTVMRSETGDRDRARADLALLARDGAVPADGFWLPAICMLAESCARLDHGDLAATLMPLLDPYAQRNAQIGLAAFLGPVHRFLGLLAAQLDDLDRAKEHFDAALERSTASGALTTEVNVLCDYGELLTSHAQGDSERGRELLDRAESTGRRLGMAAVVRRAEAAKAGAAHEPA